jgi:hypothetical protein
MQESKEVTVVVVSNGWIVGSDQHKDQAVATTPEQLKNILKAMLKPKGLNEKMVSNL